MKLVSPKTLLASLLGIAFIVIKIVTFDGVGDLAWIGLMTYWTINGLIVAFSQEAYDEDVKKSISGKSPVSGPVRQICVYCRGYSNDPALSFCFSVGSLSC